jgi:hypothetical protein
MMEDRHPRPVDTLPETPENLAERAAVRARIMNYLARLGDPEDQATALFREARELATRSGDLHVLSQVLNGFGLLRLFAGAVAEALDPLLESVRHADETGDTGLRVVVRYGLSNAYYRAGRQRECLAVADQGLGLARGDLGLGADRIGFSPSRGLSFFHGFALSLTGRPREGVVGGSAAGAVLSRRVRRRGKDPHSFFVPLPSMDHLHSYCRATFTPVSC